MKTKHVGTDSEGCSATTSKNEMEVAARMTTQTIFTLEQLEPCRVRTSEM